jgi:hypothetical protein
MEPGQMASAAEPQPDRSNANNDNSAAEKPTPFEKEQAQVARTYVMDIINKQGGSTKGKANANADLRGKFCLPYPSIETFSQPRPVDFALQGSDIYLISFMETHPQLNLKLKCPNCEGELATDGWSKDARCCHALDRTHYIVPRKYVCKSCQSESIIVIFELRFKL